MYAREFERKIKSKNSGLWINWKDANPEYGDHGSVGLYWNKDYVCAMPLTDMPEATQRAENGKILARGWRDIETILKKNN